MAKIEVSYKDILAHALKSEGKLSECYEAFHNYSFFNQCWLFAQCIARKTPIAPMKTYKGWQKLGYQVKKGSKAYMMLQPIIIKATEEEKAKGEKDSIFFRASNAWFSALDTDADIQDKVEIKEFSLSRVLNNLGIKQIPFDKFVGNAQGFCRVDTGDIAINPVAVNPIKTACHEIAHSLMHAKKDKNAENVHDSYGHNECEAECTALLVCEVLGILSDKERQDSVGYIKDWLETTEEKLIEACAKRVFSTVDKILKANQSEEGNA